MGVEHHAGVDRDHVVRARRAVADTHPAPLGPEEEPRPRSVSDRQGSPVHADRGRCGAARRVRDRGADDLRVPRGLRLRREVHPVAPAARLDVRAGRGHPRRARRDHAQHPARRRLRAEVDLGLDHVTRRGALHEHHLAARTPRDPRAAGGERLDPELLPDPRPGV